MPIITRYISRVILSSILLILIALTSLELFFLYLNELNDIGRGHYGTLQAFNFVLMSLPEQVYVMFPCVCLIGAMLGLGELAERSELTVMRSAGVSTMHIGRIVVQCAVILVLIMGLLGETAVPKLTHWAENYKAFATSQGQAMRSANGVWLRTGDAFVYIQQVVDAHHLQGIQQFRFNKAFELQESIAAKNADWQKGQWRLHDVNLSTLTNNGISSSEQSEMPWHLEINPNLLKVAALTAPEMSLWVLHHTILQQEKNHVDAGYYEFNFWERILHPFICALMMFLSVPFVFGTIRSTHGVRLILGISCGFGYFMLNRFLGPFSLVYQWPPMLAAMVPSILFLILALVLFRRAS